LPNAMELGLLSYHERCFARDELTPQLEELFNHLEKNDWNHTLVAAEYIRKHYVNGKDPQSRYNFEKNMMGAFPGNVRTLFCLAESQFLQQMPEQALTTLRQTSLLDPGLIDACTHLRETYLGADHPAVKENPNNQNILGIQLVMLIDPDSDVLFKIREMLTAVGVEQIESFEDGASAMKWMEENTIQPELIIMEWKIPKMNGPVLAQNIRSKSIQQCPIIIVSSLINKEDTQIIREMGIDAVVSKPLEQQTFYAAIVWAIQQERCPNEQKTIMMKIKRALSLKMIEESQGMIAKFMSNEQFTEGAKLEIESEYYLAQEKWQLARDTGLLALKKGGDSLALLNLVGKAMLKNQQYEDALRCFDKANSISSLNIDRMLNMAEACLNLEDHEQAEKVIDDAEKIDGQNSRVTEAKIKLKLEKGHIKSASKLMSSIASGRDIVSYMNGRAVSLAKSHRSNDAVELYARTISALPEQWPTLITSVMYNLGLSLAREGKLAEAEQTLSQVKHFKDQNIKHKVWSLRKRIKDCIQSQTKLEFFETPPPPVGTDGDPTNATHESSFPSTIRSDIKDILLQTKAERGDIGCHLIYFYKGPTDKRVEKMVAELPTFRSRRAINKKSK
ncbi:MAG: response regulator, partial [Zetaproteobacteria bacterium]|nr:response regulator [Zetaproteobacteria bacterium]